MLIQRKKPNKFKPSDPKGFKMPQAENGLQEAKRFIDVWTIYNDIEALDVFYSSLQTQFKIFSNLRNDEVSRERIQWVIDCEELIRKARQEIRVRQVK
jgi:hypothetical protein|tara:strand:- start:647 stop:940 length:294 start_codon:yes stop_codon:yes gene_type:complete